MTLQTPARDILRFLRENPSIRVQIRSARNKTLLYAGEGFAAAWREIESRKSQKNPHYLDKEILPEVIGRIAITKPPFPTLKDWVLSVQKTLPKRDQEVIWRALSGIYAANATGQVSFHVGSDISKEKVFTTEIAVLTRNQNLDPVTKEMVALYHDILRTKHFDLGRTIDINMGLLWG